MRPISTVVSLGSYNFAFLRMSCKWTHIVKPFESRFLYLALCLRFFYIVAFNSS